MISVQDISSQGISSQGISSQGISAHDSYSSKDVQQILRQASILQQNDSVSREQLLEIAAEVGISPAILEQAEQVWVNDQQIQQRQAICKARRQLGFQCHFIPYIFVSVCLVLLNLATTPRINWSIYPVLGWGMGVAMHGVCIVRKK